MRNIKLTIEYEGTHYAGWQKQKHRCHNKLLPHQPTTIQETIENALHKILREKIRLIVSGRTDAGVHALGQVANFKTKSAITEEKLKRALNGLLPCDISIVNVEQVGLDFHSRFDARAKIYRYAIFNQSHRSALLRDRAYFYRYPLDIGLMRRESKCLLGRHDFKGFQASAGKERNSIKTIRKINIMKDNDFMHIEIEADGFLYNMVRNIVGTLIEIGRFKFAKGSLKKILLAKDRKMAGPTAPACGLYLVKVKY